MIFTLTSRGRSPPSMSTNAPNLTLCTSGWSPPRSTPSTLLSPPHPDSLPMASYFSLIAPDTATITSSSLVSPPLSLCSPAPTSASTAFPNWPNRDVLSPNVSSHAASTTSLPARHHCSISSIAPVHTPISPYAACASSHITNEDLQDLECWSERQRTDAGNETVVGISWSDVKAPSVIMPEERRRKLVVRPTFETRRKRSRSVKVRNE